MDEYHSPSTPPPDRPPTVTGVDGGRATLRPDAVGWGTWLLALQKREMRQAIWSAVWHAARPLLVFAIAYIAAWSYLFTAAFLGDQPPPAPLFPPGAVLFCALVLSPPRHWWRFLVAAFLIQVPILAYLHLPLWWNLLGFIPDAVEPVVAATLLRRFIALPPRFAAMREVSIYAACAAVAVLLGATLGALVNARGGQPYLTSWQTWFLGDLLSYLVLAPTLLLWIDAGWRGLRARSRWRYMEAALLYGGLLAMGLAVFDTRLLGPPMARALIYLPVPVLLWAAVRFGPRGIASALSLIVVLAVPAVANSSGPFASQSSPATALLADVVTLQLFLLVIGVPLFFLAALIQERARAEAALRTSEARYRATFESAATGMLLLDPRGRVQQTNAPLAAILGYSEDELRGRAFTDFTHPDDVEPNLTLLRRALAGEIDSYRLEKRFIHRGGQLVWALVSTGVVRDSAARPIYLVGQVEDITERKHLEREREEARSRAERQAEELDRLFEGMAEGVLVYNREGRVVRTNPTARRLLGLDIAPPPDVSDLSAEAHRTLLVPRDLHTDRPLPPDDWLVMRALRGEVPGGSAEERDVRIRTLDGRELEVSASVAPLRDAEGHIVGAVGILRDQTERNRLARVLAEQAEQLDRIVEGVGEGLFVYDSRGRVLRTNAAARRLLGWDSTPGDVSELEADARMALYGPSEGQEGTLLSPQQWLDARSRGSGGDILSATEARDIRMRALDGRELEVSASIAPLHDPDGQVVGAVLLLSDRTERNRLVREREEARASELAVREVNQRLDTFVAMAAHDLRSPVAVSALWVQGAHQQLRKAAATVRRATEQQSGAFAKLALSLDTVEQSLDRLRRLVEQLLDVSRVRSGTLVLNRQPCQLADMVRTCVEEQRLLAPTRTIVLDMPGPDAPLVMVHADADRLSQVLTNYLTNAMRYSPENTSIEVRLRVAEVDGADGDGDAEGERAGPHAEGAAGLTEPQSGDTTRKVARVEVRDRGPGISPDEQESIWHRFQRARSVAEASGLGLGLYIARTVVELHGGRVGVESSVGKGSTFWFTVPLARAPGAIGGPGAPHVTDEAGP